MVLRSKRLIVIFCNNIEFDFSESLNKKSQELSAFQRWVQQPDMIAGVIF